jgi:hypothetical protein
LGCVPPGAGVPCRSRWGLPTTVLLTRGGFANGQGKRSCATRAHLTCGVEVPVMTGQVPRRVPSVGPPAEWPGGREQRRSSVHGECRRP